MSHPEDKQSSFCNPHTSVPDFWHRKYRQDLGKNWNLFYKRNENRFFRDRHWVEHEFPQLLNPAGTVLPYNATFFEIGCGVGNFAFPLLELRPDISILGCDISQKAIELFQGHEKFDAKKDFVFVANIIEDNLSDALSGKLADFASLIFVLSALPPECLSRALENLSRCIRVGGHLLIRDYSKDDAAQDRFNARQSQLDHHLFVRQDGTLAHFMDIDALISLTAATFEVVERKEVQCRTVNVKESLDLDRKFLQLLLRKK